MRARRATPRGSTSAPTGLAKRRLLRVAAVSKLGDLRQDIIDVVILDAVGRSLPLQQSVRGEEPQPSLIGRVELSQLLGQPSEGEQ